MAESTHERLARGTFKITIVVTLMAKHPELCVLASAILLSLISNYGFSQKADQLVIPPKTPERIFPDGSLVLDFPLGNLGPLSDILTDEELVFVMFYAPWCAESMRLRSEYEKAARVMEDRVKFAAVNCWWPEGQCRHHYKFFKYPELFVYHTHLDGFKFLGPQKAEYMVKFVEELLYPITMLHSEEQIVQFTSKQDNSLIGFFDFNSSPQPPGYMQFYYAAMRLIETDALQPVRSGLITKVDLAHELGLLQTKQLMLVRTFNTSLLYPVDGNFTCTAIQAWVNTYKQLPVVKWLSTPGYKSLHLSKEIDRGPALLIFAPINHLHTTNYYYDMLREVGLQYLRCDGHEFVDIFNERSVLNRQELLEKHVQEERLCRYWDPLDAFQEENKRNCCMSLIEVHGKQNRKICEFCWHVAKSIPQSFPRLCTMSLSSNLPEEPKFGAIQTPSCLDSAKYYNVNEYRTLCCKECHYDLSVDKCASLKKRRNTDPFVIQSSYNFNSLLCKKLTLQKIQNLIKTTEFISDFSRDFVPVNFTGSSCNSNRTIQFILMEIKDHETLLRRLYPEWNLDKVQPVAIFVDKENEAQFIFREHFSRKNLAIFMKNFTSNELQRYFRSEDVQQYCDPSGSDNCITDATSKTFLDIVMQEEKDVVLLAYTEWCAFCASLSHLFISLAKYFSSASNLVFSRINMDKNDLPWEFTVDKYPTVLFFPAYRKSDSVVFPDNVPKTLPNLIKFILNHATKDLRMDTAVDVCSKTCIENNRISGMRALVKLRRKKKIIRWKLLELNSRKIKKEVTHSKESEKTFYKLLLKLLKKLQTQINNTEVLQAYLAEHKNGNLSRKELFQKLSKQTDSDQLNGLSQHIHEEL